MYERLKAVGDLRCVLLFEGLPAEAAGERDSPPGRNDPPAATRKRQEEGKKQEVSSGMGD